MALGNLPQPAKALVEAVVNLECLWGEEEWKPALAPQLPAARCGEHSSFFSPSPSKVSPRRRLTGSMELLFSESGGMCWPELLPLRLSHLGAGINHYQQQP